MPTTHTKKEAPESGQTAGAQHQHEAAILPDNGDAGSDRQIFAQLAARAKVKGNTLLKTVDGYLLARGSYSKHCADMGSIDVLLKRTGV